MNWHNLFARGASAATSDALVVQADASGFEAQNNLGVLYTCGGAFPLDYNAAALCFHKAAEKGYALAQTNLARMYALGRGEPKDEREAAKWFRRAAVQGDAGAQFQLGLIMRRLALDVPAAAVNEFKIEAFLWLQLATIQGFFNAESACDQLNLQMSKAEVEEGKRRVASFMPIPEQA